MVGASALMGVMAPLLSKLVLMEDGYGRLRSLQPGITSLRGELSSMKAALEELSRLEKPTSPVTEWMGQLRELSYNIEDCVDDFAHGLGQQHNQNVDAHGEGLLGKIAGWIEAVRRYHRTAGRIAELKEHAVEVSHRRKRLRLEDVAPSAATAIDPRLPALFEEADRVVGIDGPREELVGWLVDAATATDPASQRRVVSIVGCAGLGKTTLANQVYQRIKGQFDCTAFVSVSRSPNVIKILTDVLLQLLGTNNTVLDGENQRGYLELVGIVREYLQDKRYFVLIDDIWSKQAWNGIQCAFPNNNNASRVMTTTRIQDVAKSCSIPHGGYVYPMKHLGINDSEKLFLKRIFDHEDDCPLELKEVTGYILKKCDGLPLAIVNIASMLATKPITKQEWGRVRNSLSLRLNTILSWT